MALNFTLMILSLLVFSTLVLDHANARLLAENKAQETTTKQGDEKMATHDQVPNTEAVGDPPKDFGDVKTIPPFTNPGFPFPTIPGGFPFPSPFPNIPIFNPPFGNIPGIPFPPFPNNIPFPLLSPPPV